MGGCPRSKWDVSNANSPPIIGGKGDSLGPLISILEMTAVKIIGSIMESMDEISLVIKINPANCQRRGESKNSV